VIRGLHGCVSSSHYLATVAGFEIMLAGGNAVDAAIATGLALHVVEPHMNGIGGECPVILHSAESGNTYAISGQGTAPKAATVDYFRKEKIDIIPGDGFLPATVPASFDVWITCLGRFGTMTLGQVIQPASRLAERGFPVYPTLHHAIRQNSERFLSEWPTTAEIFLPAGRVPEIGQVLKQEQLARTFRALAEAEALSGGDRARGLQAARDLFYKGMLARRIVEYASTHALRDASMKKHTALLTLEDFAEHQTRIEETVSVEYEGLTVHKCGPWSQGPVFLQQLQILAEYDLKAFGHNSADYIHVITEASKLAFADRERFYGDPLFTEVPLGMLLSRDYARTRKRLIKMRKASLTLRAGDGFDIPMHRKGIRTRRGDTTHLDTVDEAGNMVTATPSGGWFWGSPVIDRLGFPLGTRGEMFSLEPGHPNCIAPKKRPRTTLSPTLVTLDSRPLMAFGTPGGDQQDQWTLQFFLNHVHFGMNLQAAIDAPTFHTTHFPSSFYPRDASPGSLHLESRIPLRTRVELKRRGHKIVVERPWSNGRVTAVHYDSQNRVVSAAASSRYQTPYALGL